MRALKKKSSALDEAEVPVIALLFELGQSTCFSSNFLQKLVTLQNLEFSKVRGSGRGRKNGEWRVWRAPEQDTGPSEGTKMALVTFAYRFQQMGKTCRMGPGRDKNMFRLHNLIWSRTDSRTVRKMVNE